MKSRTPRQWLSLVIFLPPIMITILIAHIFIWITDGMEQMGSWVAGDLWNHYGPLKITRDENEN